MYILFAVLLFGILIITHELGHFVAAKLCGVRVNEFSVGMGPMLWHRTKGETTYSLRLFPIGGFCAMEGEEGESSDPRALNRQGFFKKLLIFIAGVTMNFLTGFLIVLCLFLRADGFYQADIVAVDETVLPVSAESVMPGDRLYAVNGERIYLRSDFSFLLDVLPKDENGTIELTVLRDGEKLTRTLTLHDTVDESGEARRIYGISIGGVEKATPSALLRQSWYTTISFVRTVRLSLKMMITGAVGLKELSGPIGISSEINEVGKTVQAESGIREAIESVLYLGALISVNLAVVNLLPLPALDGGHILILVLDTVLYALFRKKIPGRYVNAVNIGSFVLLMGLSVLIAVSDVVKLL